ncbi:Nucleoside phosphorylase [Caldanaerovirga acetigignens]|uniref:Nucleoside phosphorylase n=1 Tax=Caldanaerovirga acetigignens TaxID=447595 RepID=A0A1M7JU85_9FIRM|nr:purine phosphorylase [Caldanaerovirga acetigignens]SHM56107.1 Nucleoside phosphorylase [Caldanaerovirga acetigignens]
MLFIVTAYHVEAKPIIEYFGLKKVLKNSRFQVFAGKEMALVESGPGAIASACATSFLLTEFKARSKDIALNIGIAGAKNDNLKKGEAILCHKIIYNDTKRVFYPDILVKHNMKEGVLETFDFPVVKGDYPAELIEGDIVDMEGAGFFEAASFFLPPHGVHCIKVVSDYLERAVEPSFVLDIIGENLPLIEGFISSLESIHRFMPRGLSENEEKIIDKLAENLRLTFTMTHQLKNLIQYYLSKNEGLPWELYEFLNIKVNSKSEGKVYFERIKKMLC